MLNKVTLSNTNLIELPNTVRLQEFIAKGSRRLLSGFPFIRSLFRAEISGSQHQRKIVGRGNTNYSNPVQYSGTGLFR